MDLPEEGTRNNTHWYCWWSRSAEGVGKAHGEKADGELEGVVEIELVPPYF